METQIRLVRMSLSQWLTPTTERTHTCTLSQPQACFLNKYTLGPISVQVLLLTQGKVYHEYYSGMYLSGAPTKNWTVGGLNFSNGDQTNFWGPVNENISAKIIFVLRSQYSGTINGAADDGIDLWVNDALNFKHFWGSANVIDNSNFNLVKDKLYSWYSEWCQGPGPFSYTLYMIYPGVSNAAISNSNLYLPNLVGASPYSIKIVDSICGDGLRTGTEAWDDGNKNNGDGWSSIWSTEFGWTWSGGSHLNKDICNEICGDGIRFNTITSYWDDGNKNNGDGWSSIWNTESGWTWSGGLQSNKDTCNEICGDGIRFNTISTYWDDGNKNSGDGWNLVWSTESGWIWSGGSQSNKDICKEICGDGIRFNTISTYWDDGNKNNEDGWSSTCSVENGFSWSGGNSTSKDKWTLTSIQANAILIVQILSIIWVWANLLSSLLNMSSPTGVFSNNQPISAPIFDCCKWSVFVRRSFRANYWNENNSA